MNVDSILGIRQNIEMFTRAAEKIRDDNVADLPMETANMMEAERGFQANLAALKTSVQMSKSVIDIIA